MKNKELGRLLGKRKMTVDRVAEQIFSNRISVTLVLLGKRKGGVTWENLAKVLEPEELRVAKEFADRARTVLGVQEKLREAGLFVKATGNGKKLTGVLDHDTVLAIRGYQEGAGLPVTGELDQATVSKLLPEGADLYVFKTDQKKELVPA